MLDEVFFTVIMKHELVDTFIRDLWFAQWALLALLAVVLVIKKRWRSFPFFTSYVLFNCLNGPVQFFLYLYRTRVYVYSYILTEIVSVIFGLAVVYEIFVQLFSVQASLRKLANYLLGLVLALLVALSSWVVHTRAPGVKSAIAGILVSEEAARALEVGLLVFLFVCASSFGLHWRQPLFGIALGLGLFTTVHLITMTISTYITLSTGVVSVFVMLVFNISLLIWTGYMLAPERATTAEIPQKSQLEQWNRAVTELLHQ